MVVLLVLLAGFLAALYIWRRHAASIRQALSRQHAGMRGYYTYTVYK